MRCVRYERAPEAVFFEVGFQEDVTFVTRRPLLALSILVAAFGGKFLAGILSGVLKIASWREGAILGVGMNGRGGTDRILAGIAENSLHVISQDLFTALILTTFLTTLPVPVLLQKGGRWLTPMPSAEASQLAIRLHSSHSQLRSLLVVQLEKIRPSLPYSEAGHHELIPALDWKDVFDHSQRRITLVVVHINLFAGRRDDDQERVKLLGRKLCGDKISCAAIKAVGIHVLAGLQRIVGTFKTPGHRKRDRSGLHTTLGTALRRRGIVFRLILSNHVGLN